MIDEMMLECEKLEHMGEGIEENMAYNSTISAVVREETKELEAGLKLISEVQNILHEVDEKEDHPLKEAFASIDRGAMNKRRATQVEQKTQLEEALRVINEDRTGHLDRRLSYLASQLTTSSAAFIGKPNKKAYITHMHRVDGASNAGAGAVKPYQPQFGDSMKIGPEDDSMLYSFMSQQPDKQKNL